MDKWSRVLANERAELCKDSEMGEKNVKRWKGGKGFKRREKKIPFI